MKERMARIILATLGIPAFFLTGFLIYADVMFAISLSPTDAYGDTTVAQRVMIGFSACVAGMLVGMPIAAALLKQQASGLSNLAALIWLVCFGWSAAGAIALSSNLEEVFVLGFISISAPVVVMICVQTLGVILAEEQMQPAAPDSISEQQTTENSFETWAHSSVETQAGNRITVASLFQNYSEWCRINGEQALALPEFSRKMADLAITLGAEKTRNGDARDYTGIGIASGNAESGGGELALI